MFQLLPSLCVQPGAEHWESPSCAVSLSRHWASDLIPILLKLVVSNGSGSIFGSFSSSLQENSWGRPVSDMHISTLVAQWLFLPFGFRTQEFLRGGRNKHSHTAKTWKLFLLEDLQLVPQILCVPEGMVHRHCQKFSTARFCRSRWALKDIYVKILAESAWCKAVRVWGWMVLLRDVHALGFYMHLKSQGAHF